MAIHIRRREFIFTLGGAAAAWPLARCSSRATAYIGFLAANPSIQSQRVAAFVQRLPTCLDRRSQPCD